MPHGLLDSSDSSFFLPFGFSCAAVAEGCREGGELTDRQALFAEAAEMPSAELTSHAKNIFEEGELSEDSVVKESLTTAADGKNYRTQEPADREAILRRI